MAPPLASQTEAPRAAYSESVTVRWVLVPVIVSTPAGYVSDLDKTSFRLIVDGQTIPIETFERADDGPVSLVYLQDLSGSMAVGDKLHLARGAFGRLLDQAKPRDEVAIVTFAGERIEVQPFTDEPAARATMDSWRAFGTTALHDAVSWLPEVSIDSKRGRRAAVVVTDGIDNASTIDPQQARDMVRRTELPVYVLDLGTRSRPSANGGSDALEQLARGTGGDYFAPDGTLSGVLVAADAVASDLKHQYVLGFGTRGDGQFADHGIIVEVRGRKRKVRHRPDYFGRPPLGLEAGPGPAP